MLTTLLLFILTLFYVTKASNTESDYWTSEHFRSALAPTLNKASIQEADIYSMMSNELKGLFYSSEMPKGALATRQASFLEPSSFILQPRLQDSVLVGQMCFIQTRLANQSCANGAWPSGLRCP
jgi:hypothetical protein